MKRKVAAFVCGVSRLCVASLCAEIIKGIRRASVSIKVFNMMRVLDMANLMLWNDSDKSKLIELFNAGKSVDEIACQLQRTPQAVLNKCTRLSLSFRKRDKKTVLRKKKEIDENEIPCLRCRENFKSEGKFNRICDSCRNINAGYVGVVPG